MKKIFSKELVIGICVLAALFILFFGINYLKGINIFKAANYYFASYTNVEGLAVSDAVTINGFKVGQVRSIEYDYDNPGHVRVEMSLDKHLKVPVGTKAILAQGLLGTATIELLLNENQEYHKVGDVLIGERKSGMLDALAATVMPSVDEIMPKIDTLLTNLNRLTGDPALLASLQRLDAITADLKKTTNNLASVTGQIQPIINNVNSITSNVNTLTADLSEVSADLKEIPIDKIASNLQTTTDNLKLLSQELNNPNSTLGMLVKDPTLYNSLNSTVASLDSLIVDIKKNPKRYINVKVF